MLYRPLETPDRPSLASRILTALSALGATLRSRHADTMYIEGMRPDELAELGLRRYDERDYPSHR